LLFAGQGYTNGRITTLHHVSRKAPAAG